MPQNMELDIGLALSGHENPDGSWTIEPLYSVTRCVPPSNDVVATNGAIDLTKMAKTSDYSNATVISFTISSTVTDKNGKTPNIVFPYPRTDAVEFKAPPNPGQPAGSEFIVDPTLLDPSVLKFTDIDNSVGTYGYCLNLSCSNASPGSTLVLVRLDPPITNRPADH